MATDGVEATRLLDSQLLDSQLLDTQLLDTQLLDIVGESRSVLRDRLALV